MMGQSGGAAKAAEMMMAQQAGGGGGADRSGGGGGAGAAGGGAPSRTGSRSNYQDTGGDEDFDLNFGGGMGGMGNKRMAGGMRGQQKKGRQWWCLFLCRA